MNYTKTRWENDITPVSAENMNKIEDQLKVLTDAIYPVGSIYMSMSSTNPSNLFGGTWERIGVGRTLVSAGGDANAVVDTNTITNRGTNTAQTTWFPVGETGGELDHTLTTTEMPSHTHTISSSGAHGHTNKYMANISGTKGNRDLPYGSGNKKQSSVIVSSGNHTHTPANTGGGAEHNNLSPYLAVYMWKRTA